MSDDAREAAPSWEQGPIWKNPFAWAAVLGILVVTLIRPALRHVPEPPPALATLPAWSLVDQAGQPVGSATLAGQVHLVAVVSSACPGECRRTLDAAGRLEARLWQHAQPVRVLVLDLEPSGAAPLAAGRGWAADRVSVVGGDSEAACSLAAALLAPLAGPRTLTCADRALIEHAERMTLVDGQGRVRGHYRLDELGLDEAFHRARRVVMEERERARAGPG